MFYVSVFARFSRSFGLRQQVSVKYHGTVEAGLILTLIPSILVVLCVFLTRLATRARRGKIIWHFVGVGAWAGTTFLVATLMERPARWIERPDDSPYFPDLPPFPEYQLFEICDQLFKVLTFPMRWLYSDETSRPIWGVIYISAPFFILLTWGIVGYTLTSMFCLMRMRRQRANPVNVAPISARTG